MVVGPTEPSADAPVTCDPRPAIYNRKQCLCATSSAAWRAFFAAQIGWMLDAMDFLLFTFAVLAIQKEFAISKTTIGLLTSVALVASAFGGIVFGRLADRIGRVRAMTWSILIYSGATAGLATASALWQLVAWRTLVGIGMGGEWSSGSVLVAETWPAEHRAKAMGIMQSGWAIGAIIAATAVVRRPGALRMARALSLRRASRRRRVLHPPRRRGAADLARARADEGEMARHLRSNADPPDAHRHARRQQRAGCVLGTRDVAAGVSGVAGERRRRGTDDDEVRPLDHPPPGRSIPRLHQLRLDRGPHRPPPGVHAVHDRSDDCRSAVRVRRAVSVDAARDRPARRLFRARIFLVFGAMLAELFPTNIRASAQGFCYNAGRLASAAAPILIGSAAPRYGLGTALAVDALFFALGGVLIWLLPETRGRALAEVEVRAEAVV